MGFPQFPYISRLLVSFNLKSLGLLEKVLVRHHLLLSVLMRLPVLDQEMDRLFHPSILLEWLRKRQPSQVE